MSLGSSALGSKALSTSFDSGIEPEVTIVGSLLTQEVGKDTLNSSITSSIVAQLVSQEQNKDSLSIQTTSLVSINLVARESVNLDNFQSSVEVQNYISLTTQEDGKDLFVYQTTPISLEILKFSSIFCTRKLTDSPFTVVKYLKSLI